MEPEVKHEIVQQAQPTEQVEKTVDSAVENKEETPEQINWRKFRQEREKERKQAEEMARIAQQKQKETEALKAALDAVLNKPQQHQQQHDPYYQDDETEDQKIEKKVQAALEKKEREYEERRNREEQQNFPVRLKQAHSDFDSVCNTTNLDYLEFHYPEVANGFKYMPDGFEKWTNIYKAVKRFVPNADVQREDMRADKNLAKPQSMSTMNQSPTGSVLSANQLSEQKKMENWKRMQKTLKGIG